MLIYERNSQCKDALRAYQDCSTYNSLNHFGLISLMFLQCAAIGVTEHSAMNISVTSWLEVVSETSAAAVLSSDWRILACKQRTATSLTGNGTCIVVDELDLFNTNLSI